MSLWGMYTNEIYSTFHFGYLWQWPHTWQKGQVEKICILPKLNCQGGHKCFCDYRFEFQVEIEFPKEVPCKYVLGEK